LKYALEWLQGWKVVPDNFLVRVRGDGITHETIRATIDRMSEPGFWESEKTRSAIRARVPEYRLSKFQVALPEWAAGEMVGAYLLDFSGARSFLCSAEINAPRDEAAVAL
jgi:ATP-dependent Lhr-like helicase